MKRLFLIIISFLFVYQIFAQTNNVIFYTENGERFTVIMNGIRQNPHPETNVKVTGLNAKNYKVKILFEDQNLGLLEKPVFFPNMGDEYTFAVIKNKKGEYKLAYRGDVPVPQVAGNIPQQTTVVYSTTPATTTTYTETTTTTVHGTNPPNDQGVNMSMNFNDRNGHQGVNYNMNVDQGNVNMNNNAHTTTTYTTTTSTTTGNVPPPPPAQAYILPGYNGKIGCPEPMSPNDFESAKQSISSKSFEDSKLTIAKQIINSNCMLTTQVKQIMILFTFEATRLDFAKYAYTRTFDQNNYFKVNDAFTFESSIDELNQYINGIQ
ncbi:MAG: DUF4476 domain-containing protein [Bacteroidia bacterium]|nr:DUF4476 domain-containing protein [Bacteroidia bacterium]